MDGTLAVIFIVVGLTDMRLTNCPESCLAVEEATSRLSLQAGDVIFQEESIGAEAYLGYDVGLRFGPFQPTFGASLTDDNSLWVGAGGKWSTRHLIDSPLFIEASLMPGLYARGDGVNLGGALHFRSAFGVGYEFDHGGTITALYDHRSNGDTLPRNPGLETLSVRYAIALD